MKRTGDRAIANGVAKDPMRCALSQAHLEQPFPRTYGGMLDGGSMGASLSANGNPLARPVLDNQGLRCEMTTSSATWKRAIFS
jgi:hypothetical protein